MSDIAISPIKLFFWYDPIQLGQSDHKTTPLSMSVPHSRFGNDDGLQIQKAIQSLRLETQEALAEYREEIARLEEEN